GMRDAHAKAFGRAQAQMLVDLLVSEVFQRRLEDVGGRVASGRQPPLSLGTAVEGELRLDPGQAELAGPVDVVPGGPVTAEHPEPMGDVCLVPRLDRTGFSNLIE